MWTKWGIRQGPPGPNLEYAIALRRACPEREFRKQRQSEAQKWRHASSRSALDASRASGEVCGCRARRGLRMQGAGATARSRLRARVGTSKSDKVRPANVPGSERGGRKRYQVPFPAISLQCSCAVEQCQVFVHACFAESKKVRGTFCSDVSYWFLGMHRFTSVAAGAGASAPLRASALRKGQARVLVFAGSRTAHWRDAVRRPLRKGESNEGATHQPFSPA